MLLKSEWKKLIFEGILQIIFKIKTHCKVNERKTKNLVLFLIKNNLNFSIRVLLRGA